jgi:hypothetical protein
MRRSWRGVVLGVLIAFALPILYALAASLISVGIIANTGSGPAFELVMSLSLNALAAFVLGLSGIAIAGSAARLRSGWAWLVAVIVGMPLVAVAWFLSYAALGGVMGSPF